MYKLGLRVNDESIFNALIFIVNNYDCTIADIADNCRLSRATVSKILQFFLDKGLIYKHLIREKTENGVHPYRYRIDPKYNVIVFTLHGNVIKISMLDFAGKLIERDEIKLDTPFRRDQLVEFIDAFNNRFSITSLNYRIGYSISVTPGIYGENDIDKAVVAKTIKEQILLYEKKYLLHERIIDKPSFDHVGVYFARAKKYSSDKVMYIRYNFNEFYHMIFNADETLLKPIFVDNSDCINPDDSFVRVVTAIENALKHHSITRVFIDSDDYKHADSIPLIINDMAIKNNSIIIPLLDRIEAPASSKSTVTELGSLAALRDMFTNDIIKKLSE